MEETPKKRIASIAVIVEIPDSAEQVNALLHEYRNIVIGRMGLPMHGYSISLISIAVCACESEISALSGRLGRIPGVSAKVAYSSKYVD